MTKTHTTQTPQVSAEKAVLLFFFFFFSLKSHVFIFHELICHPAVPWRLGNIVTASEALENRFFILHFTFN